MFSDRTFLIISWVYWYQKESWNTYIRWTVCRCPAVFGNVISGTAKPPSCCNFRVVTTDDRLCGALNDNFSNGKQGIWLCPWNYIGVLIWGKLWRLQILSVTLIIVVGMVNTSSYLSANIFHKKTPYFIKKKYHHHHHQPHHHQQQAGNHKRRLIR